MKIRHVLQATGCCPVDGAEDRYRIVVIPLGDAVLPVEQILAHVGHLLSNPIFQEDFTRELSRRLDCRVSTVCRHSGVLTTCVAVRGR